MCKKILTFQSSSLLERPKAWREQPATVPSDGITRQVYVTLAEDDGLTVHWAFIADGFPLGQESGERSSHWQLEQGIKLLKSGWANHSTMRRRGPTVNEWKSRRVQCTFDCRQAYPLQSCQDGTNRFRMSRNRRRQEDCGKNGLLIRTRGCWRGVILVSGLLGTSESSIQRLWTFCGRLIRA